MNKEYRSVLEYYFAVLENEYWTFRHRTLWNMEYLTLKYSASAPEGEDLETSTYVFLSLPR